MSPYMPITQTSREISNDWKSAEPAVFMLGFVAQGSFEHIISN